MVNDQLSRFVAQVSASADAGTGRDGLDVADPAIWCSTSLAVSTKPVSASSTAAPNTTPSTSPVGRSSVRPNFLAAQYL